MLKSGLLFALAAGHDRHDLPRWMRIEPRGALVEDGVGQLFGGWTTKPWPPSKNHQGDA